MAMMPMLWLARERDQKKRKGATKQEHETRRGMMIYYVHPRASQWNPVCGRGFGSFVQTRA